MEKQKNILIFILCFIIVLLGGMVLNYRQEAQMQAYAAENNCEWHYQNTMYGDNRDYICK